MAQVNLEIVLFAFLENDHQSLCICPVNHLLIFRVAENHRMAAAEGIIRQRLHTVRDNDQPQQRTVCKGALSNRSNALRNIHLLHLPHADKGFFLNGLQTRRQL